MQQIECLGRQRDGLAVPAKLPVYGVEPEIPEIIDLFSWPFHYASLEKIKKKFAGTSGLFEGLGGNMPDVATICSSAIVWVTKNYSRNCRVPDDFFDLAYKDEQNAERQIEARQEQIR